MIKSLYILFCLNIMFQKQPEKHSEIVYLICSVFRDVVKNGMTHTAVNIRCHNTVIAFFGMPSAK